MKTSQLYAAVQQVVHKYFPKYPHKSLAIPIFTPKLSQSCNYYMADCQHAGSPIFWEITIYLGPDFMSWKCCWIADFVEIALARGNSKPMPEAPNVFLACSGAGWRAFLASDARNTFLWQRRPRHRDCANPLNRRAHHHPKNPAP